MCCPANSADQRYRFARSPLDSVVREDPAQLGAVQSGITALESEFLANIVLPDGGTVGQWLASQIDEAYATGRMPPMLASAST